MNPYEKLANAIILQAVADYREALSRYYQHPEIDKYLQEKDEFERFFHSGLFGVLTNIDPEFLIAKLKKEVSL